MGIGLNKHDALQVKIGDKLIPHESWNKSMELNRQLLSIVTVKSIRYQKSQTGVMLSVVSLSGQTIEIDAGWFTKSK